MNVPVPVNGTYTGFTGTFHVYGPPLIRYNQIFSDYNGFGTGSVQWDFSGKSHGFVLKNGRLPDFRHACVTG